MKTLAYLYKWTHIPTGMWYVGSRSAKGCHPNDGYLCSSHKVKKLILENKSDWIRDILILGGPEYIVGLENNYLQALDAKNDPMSFNKHNGDGIFVSCGDKNPMKDPLIAKKVADSIRGDNHWTKQLGDKIHPQKGQKRPSIAGDSHPNKRKEVALKISQTHSGRKHDYALGDKNVMRNPIIAAKLSGENHWTTKHEKYQCNYCGLVTTKSNHTRWHGENCKRR